MINNFLNCGELPTSKQKKAPNKSMGVLKNRASGAKLTKNSLEQEVMREGGVIKNQD
jgi:hypothetical protein